MQEFDKAFVEGVLSVLDERSRLFSQFAFTKSNNELKLLGTGGFSSVYEMYNKERPKLLFALKVIGFQRHTVSSAEFWNAGRIQWILCQESDYIMRVLDTKELLLSFNDKGNITEIKDAEKEAWEEDGNSLHLQLVLMERLDELIEKDRFGKVRLLREELNTESEALKLGFQIGQALALAHNNRCLHRDIKIENIFGIHQNRYISWVILVLPNGLKTEMLKPSYIPTDMARLKLKEDFMIVIMLQRIFIPLALLCICS